MTKKRPTKPSLKLRRETLAPLTDDGLKAVQGGAGTGPVFIEPHAPAPIDNTLSKTASGGTCATGGGGRLNLTAGTG